MDFNNYIETTKLFYRDRQIQNINPPLFSLQKQPNKLIIYPLFFLSEPPSKQLNSYCFRPKNYKIIQYC